MPMAASSWRPRRCSSTGGCRGRATRPVQPAGKAGRAGGELALEPDAGIWEYRGRKRVHTHSAAMCWAGCQRLAAIAAHLGLADRAQYWGSNAARIGRECLEQRLEPERKAFAAAFGIDDLDASVLLLPELALIEPDDPRFVSTVGGDRAGTSARRHVMRYVAEDDFGLPETAFLVCRFWLIDALWAIGRREEARDMFIDALRLRNRYGIVVGRHASADRRAVGKFSADLFDGRINPDRDAAVAKLGGSILARLVIVSNRVAIPDSGSAGRRAGGGDSADAQAAAGVWFGWSGRVAARQPGTAKHRRARRRLLRDHRSAQGRLPGILQRFRQPSAVADPALPAGSRRIHPPRSVPAICASTSISPSELAKMLRPDDIVWVHDYHLIPLAKALRERGHKNKHRLLPAYPVAAAGNPHRAAQSREADSGAVPLRPGRLPDRRSMPPISRAIWRTNAGCRASTGIRFAVRRPRSCASAPFRSE